VAPSKAGTALTVSDSAFSHNTASVNGGAIDSHCQAWLTGTTFDQNSAGSDGGAIYQDSWCFGDDDNQVLQTFVTSSEFHGNTAGADGGAIANLGVQSLEGPGASASVSLTRSQVSGNSAQAAGGGIYNPSGSVTLSRSRIQDNHPDNCAPARSVPGCTD
jgi:hypothetical protein